MVKNMAGMEIMATKVIMAYKVLDVLTVQKQERFIAGSSNGLISLCEENYIRFPVHFKNDVMLLTHLATRACFRGNFEDIKFLKIEDFDGLAEPSVSVTVEC